MIQIISHLHILLKFLSYYFELQLTEIDSYLFFFIFFSRIFSSYFIPKCQSSENDRAQILWTREETCFQRSNRRQTAEVQQGSLKCCLARRVLWVVFSHLVRCALKLYFLTLLMSIEETLTAFYVLSIGQKDQNVKKSKIRPEIISPRWRIMYAREAFLAELLQALH